MAVSVYGTAVPSYTYSRGKMDQTRAEVAACLRHVLCAAHIDGPGFVAMGLTGIDIGHCRGVNHHVRVMLGEHALNGIDIGNIELAELELTQIAVLADAGLRSTRCRSSGRASACSNELWCREAVTTGDKNAGHGLRVSLNRSMIGPRFM